MKSFIGYLTILLFCVVAAVAMTYGALKYESTKYDNEVRILGIFIYHTLEECNEKLGAHGEPANFNLTADDITVENLKSCLKRLSKHEEVTSPIPLE